MAENKTRQTNASVRTFLDTVESDVRRRDAVTLIALMRRVTGVEPKMWGPTMIGFGAYHYKYESGREGDMMRLGFSPRKASLSLYLIGPDAEFKRLLAKLGKHKRSVACIYVNKLADVDMDVLERMVAQAWVADLSKYGCKTE